MSFTDITQEFEENARYSKNFWEPYITDARTYTNAAAGFCWSDAERARFRKEGREPLELNIMRRGLSFFSGWMRDNMNSVVYTGIEDADEETADQLTKLGYHIWDKGKGFPVLMDAADEAFKAGMSLCGIMIDKTEDFIDGDIRFYNLPYNRFYLDPHFTKIDLWDCGYAILRDYVDIEIAKKLLSDLPGKEIEDLNFSF